MSFRTEEKVPLTTAQMESMLRDLSERGLTPLHPPRRVNSVYFDNLHAQAFRDSEEGVVPRRKVRIRCYPDQNLRGYRFETKVSALEGRFKDSRVLTAPEREDLLARGLIDTQYGVMMPRVAVAYERSYWTFGEIRLTTDRDIRYQVFGDAGDARREPLEVLEIKALSAMSPDFLRGMIPTGRARFSKFSNAMRALLPDLGCW